MHLCGYYHTVKRYSPLVGRDVIEGTCWGTKEAEICLCEGRKNKCDFYPKIKKQALLCDAIEAEHDSTEIIRLVVNLLKLGYDIYFDG